MITIDDDGTKVLSFEDWTPDMKALASAMWDLPPRPGTDCPTHEYGIDRLANERYGRQAMRLLYDCVDELDHCPDEREVVRLGRTMILVDYELTKLLRSRRRSRPAPRRSFVRRPRPH